MYLPTYSPAHQCIGFAFLYDLTHRIFLLEQWGNGNSRPNACSLYPWRINSNQVYGSSGPTASLEIIFITSPDVILRVMRRDKTDAYWVLLGFMNCCPAIDGIYSANRMRVTHKLLAPNRPRWYPSNPVSMKFFTTAGRLVERSIFHFCLKIGCSSL